MSCTPINSLLEIRDSLLHGCGVFARQLIPAGTRLLEYTGERITKLEADRRCEAGNVYIIGLDETWDIDGAVGENPARFINHSCEPNCEAVIEEEVTLQLGAEEPKLPGDLSCKGLTSRSHIWVDTIRDLVAGEEVTFNYGYDLADYLTHPCRCGQPTCVGYIVAAEFFPQLRRKSRKRRKRTARIPNSK
jgi:SET domain-containing protein